MIEVIKCIEKRIEKLMYFMKEKNLDFIIISNPENIFYYTNFNPIIYSNPPFVIIKKTGECILLLHSIRKFHAEGSKNIFGKILFYGFWGETQSIGKTFQEALIKIVGITKIKLGIEMENLNLKLFLELKEKLNIENIFDVTGFIKQQRIIKDIYEIDCIRKAAELSDLGVKTVIKYLEIGYSELEACTEAHYQMRKRWQEKYSDYEVSGFGTKENGQIDSLNVWCMSNERIIYGCDCPINYKVKKGDLILPMAWARIGGYAAETERTIFVKELTEEKSKLFETVLATRDKIFSMIKPNIIVENLYIEAIKIFIEKGFEKVLPGRIGHGIGLSTHGFPSITLGNKEILKENMVLTIEPGIMMKDYGIRHSDTILITKDGFEFLTNLERGKIKINKE
ncbi:MULTISPECIES: Xaa-Pro peptidase family protein [Fusobacterium]|uniref:M24 family metallopeptidase n=1 Tax=Fusobacterium TaxID=848 RepID=UPI001477264A|nr:MULTISPECIES: Xaa-Pro peptidase family protein [Fusobacterium]NME36293.1 aminopeptidase P family protein [Fusobacterium sp. FSA-380-WT-3A]